MKLKMRTMPKVLFCRAGKHLPPGGRDILAVRPEYGPPAALPLNLAAKN